MNIADREEVFGTLVHQGFDHTLKYFAASCIKLIRGIQTGDPKVKAEVMLGLGMRNKSRENLRKELVEVFNSI